MTMKLDDFSQIALPTALRKFTCGQTLECIKITIDYCKSVQVEHVAPSSSSIYRFALEVLIIQKCMDLAEKSRGAAENLRNNWKDNKYRSDRKNVDIEHLQNLSWNLWIKCLDHLIIIKRNWNGRNKGLEMTLFQRLADLAWLSQNSYYINIAYNFVNKGLIASQGRDLYLFLLRGRIFQRLGDFGMAVEDYTLYLKGATPNNLQTIAVKRERETCQIAMDQQKPPMPTIYEKKMYKKFNLTSDSSVIDIKKTLNKMYLQHHPDKHMGEPEEKRKKHEQAFIESKKALDYLKKKREVKSRVNRGPFTVKSLNDTYNQILESE